MPRRTNAIVSILTPIFLECLVVGLGSIQVEANRRIVEVDLGYFRPVSLEYLSESLVFLRYAAEFGEGDARKI